ncbi:DUF72 domain-containing protein [Variovorax sp. J22G21]|uniref:DUF72 domain-containing protein n=1 Tax=Variovorax fucosicus TaxID=3053517 RepID=UPI002575FF04|nr:MULTISPECIES: DUF72 domain-containing protein [unclassified Variovorax]MDM0037899.1 DUF72 domain-containing protein [Variovorax sp. J22R193]MDM0062675.1 DUF72 domain-containing protein [Variovorax sp. J22G21]
MSILVGTASWTDKTLMACGRFYPKEAKTSEARLRYYASIFRLVEVDSSFYGIPAPANAKLWAERTPEAFTFNVKAFRLFTGHQTDPKVLHRDIQQTLATPKTLYYRDTPPEISVELWRRFREAIAPLRQAGKLGLVHFQYPPWLVCNREGHAHVAHCVEQMTGHTVSIEFRHRSWLDEAHRAGTIEFLRRLGAVHTIVDGPQGFANSVPLLAEATNPDFALVRLHGRNVDTYNIKGAESAAERFDYDYPDQELREIMMEVVRLASKARNTHIVFNNCDEDKGQRNGITFMKMLLAHG